MIGDEYFDLRSRLGAALFSLRTLVGEGATGGENAVILGSLVTSLKDPFVFVVVGEVNVGKSTFLNALFGADFSKTGILPTTDKIFYFKHGDSLRHVPISRTLEEVHVPADFLRDFHIVDTPGTNSIENEHQEITERFVPLADLVIFVFSAMNPWGASAWQFLEKVHTLWMRNVIFVLQQCDLREPEEIQSIITYMQQLTRQRFGRDFPIFPVAAKKAFLARSTGVDREQLLAASGFLKLEEQISKIISGSGARLAKMVNALRIAREILVGVSAQSSQRAAGIGEKSSILRNIASGLAAQSERTAGKLSHVIEATCGDYEHAASKMLDEAAPFLTPVASLQNVLREKRSGVGMEKSLLDQLRAASAERWGRAATILEDDVNAASEQLTTQLVEALKAQPGDDIRHDASFWQSQRRKFLSRADSIFQRVIGGTTVENRVAFAHRTSRKFALGQVMATIAGLGLAAALAATGHLVAASGSLAAGMILFFILHLSNARSLARSRHEIRQSIASGSIELRRQLGERVSEETQEFFENFGKGLLPLRDRIAEQEARHEGQMRKIDELIDVFDELEQRLHSAMPRAEH